MRKATTERRTHLALWRLRLAANLLDLIGREGAIVGWIGGGGLLPVFDFLESLVQRPFEFLCDLHEFVRQGFQHLIFARGGAEQVGVHGAAYFLRDAAAVLAGPLPEARKGGWRKADGELFHGGELAW